MMNELNRDDLINLLKLTLARVNELEEIISKDEGWDVNPKFKHSPYPPNWPYGQKSKKTMEQIRILVPQMATMFDEQTMNKSMAKLSHKKI